MLEALSVERLIRKLQVEEGGFTLTANYSGDRYPFTICDKWELLGVTVSDKELSILAQKEGQPPMQFSAVKPKHRSLPDNFANAQAWFVKIDQAYGSVTTVQKKQGECPAKKPAIPENVVFTVVVTEFVKKTKTGDVGKVA